MRCPYCGSEDSQVKDSRPAEDGAAIRRRRVCPDCGGRFTTFERVQLRDLQVLKCLAEGMSNQEIAVECVVSVSTVKNHVSRLLEYFGATDRANLVYEAMKAGTLTQE